MPPMSVAGIIRQWNARGALGANRRFHFGCYSRGSGFRLLTEARRALGLPRTTALATDTTRSGRGREPALTDRDGRYEIRYSSAQLDPSDKDAADLIVRAYDADAASKRR